MGVHGRWAGRLSLVAFALAAVPAPAAPGACQLVKVAELSVTTAHNRPLAAVSLNGHAARMLVDTGSELSALWRPTIESLGLHDVDFGTKVYGINGSDEVGILTVRDFGLGDAVVHGIRLRVIGRGKETAFVGLLGDDFLAKFDVEFDLASQVIRLFAPKNCAGDQVVYWANAYSMTPLLHRFGGHGWPLVKVQLNGREALALLDSGSIGSLVASDVTRLPGMGPDAPAMTAAPIRGVTSQPLDSSLAVFPTLAIGQEQVQNVKLRVADLWRSARQTVTGSHLPKDPDNMPQMIIGADFFLAHRIYLAHSQDKVYFTYHGGPIFQTTPPEPATPAASAAAADDAASSEQGTRQE